MQIARTVREFQELRNTALHTKHGFVPTMGALHMGHISLVGSATAECDLVSVSIFVNPTQFNDKEDLKNYPRTEKKDIDLLAGVLRESDIIFIPPAEEIYPEKDTRVFSFGNLGSVMEGAHRPGHFNGVAQVVSRLFDIAEPDVAYFGQKDFQQLAIIKELERQRGDKIKIKSCPTVREEDGLAMSSRNMLLEPEHRKKASVIYRSLSEASAMRGKRDITELKKYVTDAVNSTEGFITEYFEIADERTLEPLDSLNKLKPGNRYFGCIAVRAGKIRLIDNIEFQLQ
jgi:pantoate--beta-alanine ligase